MLCESASSGRASILTVFGGCLYKTPPPRPIGDAGVYTFRRCGPLLVIVAATAGGVGCSLFDRRMDAEVVGYREQLAAIREVVPAGTTRDRAVSRLNAAGLVGEFSPSSQSIYYCLRWNREDGGNWEMSVALLFNERGEFYGVQPSYANELETTQGTRFDGPPKEDDQSNGDAAPTGRPTVPFPSPTADDLNRSAGSGSPRESGDPRLGRRSPFEAR